MSAEPCFTCSESGGVVGECPEGRRPCKHHCNCVWDQDVCHWCGAEINDDGDLIPNYAPIEMSEVPA